MKKIVILGIILAIALATVVISQVFTLKASLGNSQTSATNQNNFGASNSFTFVKFNVTGTPYSLGRVEFFVTDNGTISGATTRLMVLNRNGNVTGLQLGGNSSVRTSYGNGSLNYSWTSDHPYLPVGDYYLVFAINGTGQGYFRVGETTTGAGEALLGELVNISGIPSFPFATVNSLNIRLYAEDVPALVVNLTAPPTASFQANSVINFTSNATSQNLNLTNVTVFVWNSNGSIFNMTGRTVNGTFNDTTVSIANFGFSSYIWNSRWCGLNSSGGTRCTFAPSNFTLTTGNFTEEFTYSLIEGQSTDVNLNVTFEGLNTNILALLYWNNTQVSPSKAIINSSRVKFSTNFVVPIGTGNATGRNITHYWRYYYPDNSLNTTTANATQNVYSLGLDNCATFGTLLLNYTLYDEDTIALINGTGVNNGTIEVLVDVQSLSDPTQQTNFSRSYNNTNNARVCISQIASGFRIDAQARYTANSYVTEFYNIQNSTLSASNFPQHIRLFPLLSSRSQEFLVTFKDENFAPVENALITISRKYVGEGLFRTVEAPETNVDGQALVHLVLGDVIYTIQVSKEGELLGTFENIVAFCTNIQTGECTINLNALSSGTTPTNFETDDGLAYNIVFDKDARTITSTFSVLDGSISTINLTGTLFDNRGNTTACSTTVQTSSGSLTCSIPLSIGNSTIRAILYKNGDFVAQRFFSLTNSDDTGFGGTGIILVALLVITIPLMMVSSGAGVVVGAILGLVFAGLLNLYNGGGILGVTSAITWLVIAGAVILWKINSVRSG